MTYTMEQLNEMANKELARHKNTMGAIREHAKEHFRFCRGDVVVTNSQYDRERLGVVLSSKVKLGNSFLHGNSYVTLGYEVAPITKSGTPHKTTRFGFNRFVEEAALDDGGRHIELSEKD